VRLSTARGGDAMGDTGQERLLYKLQDAVERLSARVDELERELEKRQAPVAYPLTPEFTLTPGIVASTHGEAWVPCSGQAGPDGRCTTCGTEITTTGGTHSRRLT
jgi:hypothetical protein